jgi:choline dehydrogenase-like flavoprotein
MATEKADVVIVGVRAAGAILAAELGKSGMKVVGLERGPRLKTADFEPHDGLMSPSQERAHESAPPADSAHQTDAPPQNRCSPAAADRRNRA